MGLLRSTLNDPVQGHEAASLTVDPLSPLFPGFDPDSELPCDYCIAVAELLACRTLARDKETTLTGLLAERVSYFAAELSAPRWICTAGGVKLIEEVAP